MITDNNFKAEIITNRNFISYQADGIQLSLQKRDCNTHIIGGINNKIDQLLKKPFLNETRFGFLKLKIDNTTGYESQSSDRAKFFRSFDLLIKKAKIEEFLNCSK